MNSMEAKRVMNGKYADLYIDATSWPKQRHSRPRSR